MYIRKPRLAPNVVIEPFVTIDKNVVIGEGHAHGFQCNNS